MCTDVMYTPEGPDEETCAPVASSTVRDARRWVVLRAWRDEEASMFGQRTWLAQDRLFVRAQTPELPFGRCRRASLSVASKLDFRF